MAINYNEIIENLKDEDVFRLLERLGAEPIDKGDFILCKTICHNPDPKDASYKLYYYKNSHIFYCYTEDGAQSIFKFLKHYYETRNLVYDWFQDILQVVLTCAPTASCETETAYRAQREQYTRRKINRVLPTFNKGIIDSFNTYYPIEWLQDGISKETMQKFNIRFDSINNKVIIPHYDIKGRLVGIRGRALNPEEVEQFGKYAPIQLEGKWYSHPLSLNLYGLNFTKGAIKELGIVYVLEAEKGVLQLDSFPKFRNCGVAVCGSNFNKFQMDILVRNIKPREVVLCFDNEEKPKEDTYFQKLWNICQRYKQYCNMSFIYDRDHITNLKDSPTDKGPEIFQRLLKERVRVY